MSVAQVPLSAEIAVRSRFISSAELADRLAVSSSCLANWRKSGSGPPFVKVNGVVRYAETDVDAFMASARRTA